MPAHDPHLPASRAGRPTFLIEKLRCYHRQLHIVVADWLSRQGVSLDVPCTSCVLPPPLRAPAAASLARQPPPIKIPSTSHRNFYWPHSQSATRLCARPALPPAPLQLTPPPPVPRRSWQRPWLSMWAAFLCAWLRLNDPALSPIFPLGPLPPLPRPESAPPPLVRQLTYKYRFGAFLHHEHQCQSWEGGERVPCSVQ